MTTPAVVWSAAGSISGRDAAGRPWRAFVRQVAGGWGSVVTLPDGTTEIGQHASMEAGQAAAIQALGAAGAFPAPEEENEP